MLTYKVKVLARYMFGPLHAGPRLIQSWRDDAIARSAGTCHRPPECYRLGRKRIRNTHAFKDKERKQTTALARISLKAIFGRRDHLATRGNTYGVPIGIRNYKNPTGMVKAYGSAPL
jgi:hypothetical protein